MDASVFAYTVVQVQLLVNQLEPLTEQQMSGLSNLQQSSQQAEDALSQGMEALQQSLAETLAGSLGTSGSSGNVANYMGQMAMAMGKLGTIENFLRQVNFVLRLTLLNMWSCFHCSSCCCCCCL
jgi:transcription factor TGA